MMLIIYQKGLYFMKKFVLSCMGTLAALSTPGKAETLQPAVQYPEFYIGMGIGAEKFKGTRNEKIRDTLPIPGPTITITNNNPINDEKGTFFGMAGFLWNIPNTPLLVGPEIYCGRSTAEHVKSFQQFSALAIAFQAYQNRFQRKTYWGGNLRIGIPVQNNFFLYVSGGIESANFQNTITFAQDPAGTAPQFVKFGKWMNGARFAVGVEKKIDRFKIGLDLSMVRFGSFSISRATNFAADILDLRVKPKIYTLSARVSYVF